MLIHRLWRWWMRPTRVDNLTPGQMAESEGDAVEEGTSSISSEIPSVQEIGEGDGSPHGKAITGFDWSDRAIRAAMEETEIGQLSNTSAQLSGELFQAASDFRKKLLELAGNAESLLTQDDDTIVVASPISNPSISQAKQSSPRNSLAGKPQSRGSRFTFFGQAPPSKKLSPSSGKPSKRSLYPNRSPPGVSKVPAARARPANPPKRSHSANALMDKAYRDMLRVTSMIPARDFTWQGSQSRDVKNTPVGATALGKPSKSVVDPPIRFKTPDQTAVGRRASSIDPTKVRIGPYPVLPGYKDLFAGLTKEQIDKSSSSVKAVPLQRNNKTTPSRQKSPPSKQSSAALRSPFYHIIPDYDEPEPLSQVQQKRLSTSKSSSRSPRTKSPATPKKPATTPKARVSKAKAPTTPKARAATTRSATPRTKTPATPKKRQSVTPKSGTAKSTPKTPSQGKSADVDVEPVTPVVTRTGRAVKPPKNLADEQDSLPKKRGGRKTTTAQSSPAKKSKPPPPVKKAKSPAKTKAKTKTRDKDTIYVHASNSESDGDEMQPLEEHDEDVIEGEASTGGKKRKRMKEEDRVWKKGKEATDEEEEMGDTVKAKKRKKAGSGKTKWNPLMLRR